MRERDPDECRVLHDNVRRKRRSQAADSRARHTKSMSLKTTVGITALAVLGCAAGGFFWLRARGEQHPPEGATAEPPGFREMPPAERPPNAAAVKSTLPSESKKAAPPADTEVTLRACEGF